MKIPMWVRAKEKTRSEARNDHECIACDGLCARAATVSPQIRSCSRWRRKRRAHAKRPSRLSDAAFAETKERGRDFICRGARSERSDCNASRKTSPPAKVG